MPPESTPHALIRNRRLDDLRPGDTAGEVRLLGLPDIAPATLDLADLPATPLDDIYTRQEQAPHPVPHGLWVGAMVTELLLSHLPGPGADVQELALHHLGPASLGDRLSVQVTVLTVDLQTGEVRLACTIDGPGGLRVAAGEARVLAARHSVTRPAPGPHARPHSPGARFRLLVDAARALPPLRTAVVHPCDDLSLTGALEAAAAGLILPVWVGPRDKILATAAAAGVTLDPADIVDAPHSHAAADVAVAEVRAGRCAALMKGKLHTDELLAAVVDRDTGLRTERRLSHVFALDVPDHPRLLFITDGAINIAPDLETLRDIVQNALDLVIALGVPVPRLALLSAVETVTGKIPSTLMAAAICKMHDRGQITGGKVDGPLAFDNAISPAAALAKGIVSDVAGRAEILVAPDLESANMIAKQLIYLAKAESAGIALGARVPIMLTSRADGPAARMASAALARLQAERQRAGRV